MTVTMTNDVLCRTAGGEVGISEPALPDLTDPNVVHINMLHGTIARPSLSQIVHVYGSDALREYLLATYGPATARAEAAEALLREAGVLLANFSAYEHMTDRIDAFLGDKR